jgi:Ca-activated chloride channel family protein
MKIAWAKSSPAVQQSRCALGLQTSVRPGRLLRALFALVVALVASGYGAAQDGTSNEAHVLPRAIAPSLAAPVLRVNVDLVLVPVTVLDRTGRAVTGLKPTNFSVLDDKDPQVVRYLSNEDEPISLAVVLDSSASMATKIEDSRKAFTTLVNTSNPLDDVSLIVVSDKPRVALHFDNSAIEIQRAEDALQPDGATALWDGMYLGITELKIARHQRKAMVVISDGGDNHSRCTESELKSLLKEADVEVYAIGMFDRYATRLEEKRGPLELDEVTSVTGGRVLSVHDSAELSLAVTQISRELRNHYVLGYYPSNRNPDGKWRRLKVRLAGSASEASFRLYAKKGYYAPTE